MVRGTGHRGFVAVRTSALATAASARVESHGFTVIQELVLLQHDEPGSAPSPATRTSRLLVGNDPVAADLDRAAFGARWSLDATAVHDVRTATPRHRARAVLTSGPGDAPDAITGYAITGRDSRRASCNASPCIPTTGVKGWGWPWCTTRCAGWLAGGCNECW